jgi:hypothetical protein
MRARLYDNTRIKDYKRCPRYYYFRHLCDWKSGADKALPLVFGGSWGEAMNVVWPLLCRGEATVDTAMLGFEAFIQKWREYDLPYPLSLEQEQDMAPRTPGVALEMLVEYVEQRRMATSEMELIEVERPFVVPLDPEDDTLFYVGRMDKVVKRRGKVMAIEHKTTTAYKISKTMPFRAGFLDSFSPESQIDGYLFALHMDFPGLVGGCWVDAALVHKTVNDGFTFIPIERQLRHLDAWLWEVRSWISQVEAHTMALKDLKKSDPYMAAFPKNTNSCFDFARSCSFLDLCKARPNPLQWEGEPPMGYIRERWDPLDHIPQLKERLSAEL